jgi:hypothetical protein
MLVIDILRDNQKGLIAEAFKHDFQKELMKAKLKKP